jgi:cation diffusion facilitator CzcD-associated flavoprotein CzcO
MDEAADTLHRVTELQTRVVLVGAGQAGLSAAFHLRRLGLSPGTDFVMLDANDGPGGAWQHRWPSLTLGTTHRVADLPGMPLGSPDPQRPSADVVAEYYRDYEQTFELQVRRPVRVQAVTSPAGPRGPLVIAGATDTGEVRWHSPRLISATGSWERPYWPAYPGRERFRGRQLHTHDFYSVDEFRDQHVIVVGGGTSAVQFLLQLQDVATTTWVTRRPPVFSEREFDEEWGRDVERRVTAHALRGLPPTSVVANTGLALTPAYRQGIASGVLVAREMFAEIIEDGVRFADSSVQRADTILWATGFRPALGHLAPLRLREHGGGIRVEGTTVLRDARIELVGYGAAASTLGATRAGRRAALNTIAGLATTAA